jgi:8-oxo-dGTP pyrophosphatase MutT (NUDIX family)
MTLTPADFELPDQQIAQLKADVEKQRGNIAALKADGGDTTEAEVALREVEEALQTLIDFRDALFGQMGQ